MQCAIRVPSYPCIQKFLSLIQEINSLTTKSSQLSDDTTRARLLTTSDRDGSGEWLASTPQGPERVQQKEQQHHAVEESTPLPPWPPKQ